MEKKTKSIKIPVVLLLLIAIAVVVVVLFICKKTKDSKVGQESPYKNDESNIQLNNIVNNTIDDNSTVCLLVVAFTPAFCPSPPHSTGRNGHLGQG